MNELTLDPNPNILIESLRDIGYSFKSAMADIIDNSITSGASDVRILAYPVNGEFTVGVVDNGTGLTRDQLLEAMRLGSTNPRERRRKDDLGRFGLGLKTASFSQCRRLTVLSRKQGVISSFTWDLDEVVRKNAWVVLENPDPSKIPFFEQLEGDGTVVCWEELDRLPRGSKGELQDSMRILKETREHLELVFHRYLSGEPGLKRVGMSLNGTPLEPLDPFNRSSDKTLATPRENLAPGVSIQGFTLPHKSLYDSEKDYKRYGLSGGYFKNQGIYLYRNKRLIIHGTWLGVAKRTQLTQLSRILIDIDNNQDEAWKIDVKKVSAQIPARVRNRVQLLAERLGAPSRRIFRQRKVEQISRESYPIWKVSHTREGKNVYEIDREHPSIRQALASGDDAVESLLRLVESGLPLESIFYDFAEQSTDPATKPLEQETLAVLARDLYNSIAQTGVAHNTVLSMLQTTEKLRGLDLDELERMVGGDDE